MAGLRLTSLEFHWFGKGQLLATRYQHGEAMDLDAAAADLSALVAAGAKVSFAGAESLRRVAVRFGLDADEAGGPAYIVASRLDRVGADRRVRALRRLAAHFESVAIDVEIWKRHQALIADPAASATSP